MDRTQTRYSVFGRVLLAIYVAIRHFRCFLERRAFHVLTDHKPLACVFRTSHSEYFAREVRLLAYVSEFSTNIRHVRGIGNSAADALSCTVASIQHCSIGLEDIAAAQVDSEIRQLQTTDETSLTLRDVSISSTLKSIICDTSAVVNRIVIPATLRKNIFDAVKQSDPSWCARLPEASYSPVCLAQHAQRHPTLGKVLHPLPAV